MASSRLVPPALAALAALAMVASASRARAHEDHEHDAKGEHPKPAPADATGFHDPPTEANDIHVHGDAPPRSATETVRDRSIIRATPHRTAGDVLMIVPGVFVTQHSGQGKAYQIFFRGFDSVHGQDVELWVGGAPVNDVSNIHGQGYADLHFVMPEVITEVRSLPGTYDPRQGDFAVAGTMRFELASTDPERRARRPWARSASGAAALQHWSLAPYLVFRSLRLRQDYTGFLVDRENGDHVQQTPHFRGEGECRLTPG